MARPRARPGGVHCRSPGPGSGRSPGPGPIRLLGPGAAPRARGRRSDTGRPAAGTVTAGQPETVGLGPPSESELRRRGDSGMIIMRPVDSDSDVSDILRFMNHDHVCQSLARCPGWQPGPPGTVQVIGVIGPPGLADSESGCVGDQSPVTGPGRCHPASAIFPGWSQTRPLAVTVPVRHSMAIGHCPREPTESGRDSGVHRL